LYVILGLSIVISQIHWIQSLAILFENSRYAYYFSGKILQVSIFKILALNTVAVFVLFHATKMKEVYVYQKYFLILFVLSVIVTNILASRIDLTRLAYYFKIFEVIVIADLIVLGTNKRRNWLFVLFYLYYFAAFMNSLKVDLEKTKLGTKFTPYSNLFFELKE
jgi:hypothetical protein